MTRDELAEVIRLAIVGVGHRVDQVELVRGDDGRGIMVYAYEGSEPDAEVRVFALPDSIAAKVA